MMFAGNTLVLTLFVVGTSAIDSRHGRPDVSSDGDVFHSARNSFSGTSSESSPARNDPRTTKHQDQNIPFTNEVLKVIQPGDEVPTATYVLKPLVEQPPVPRMVDSKGRRMHPLQVLEMERNARERREQQRRGLNLGCFTGRGGQGN